MKKIYAMALCATALATNVQAQDENPAKSMYFNKEGRIKEFYLTSGGDGMLFSLGKIQNVNNGVTKDDWSNVRFTWWLNIGEHVHYNFNNTVGLYSGLELRNIGYNFHEIRTVAIENSTPPATVDKEYVVRRRTYNLGIPLALKIGNMRNKNYFFLGGGIDMAFAYKEKSWEVDNKKNTKVKHNEWFSDEVNLWQPFVFAGFVVKPGIGIKVAYYPSNYHNENYTASNGAKKYNGTTVNLFAAGLTMDISNNKKKN